MKNTFKVYVSRKDEVEKSLVKLSKKAIKYNVPLSWQWGAVSEERVQVLVPTPCQSVGGGMATMLYPVHKYYVQAQELLVDMQPIHEHGWSILAHIEKLDGSDQRLVTLVTAEETDPLWRVWDMRCDHCQTHRARKAVYICQHDDGRVVSVGSTCLKEYTGIDPASVFSWALVKDVIGNDDDGEGCNWRGGFSPRYDVKEVLAYAIQEVEAYGYVKSGEPHSTRDRVHQDFLYEEEVKPGNLARAEAIVSWVKSQDDFSDYMANCKAICQCQSVESKRFGYLCYLPVAYEKAMERERQKMKKLSAESCSQYLGEIGKRLDVVVKEINIVTSWESVYGTTFIYKIVDNVGNILTWKTSVMVPDEVKSLKGTVKAHSEYRGIKQTELTRCKVS